MSRMPKTDHLDSTTKTVLHQGVPSLLGVWMVSSMSFITRNLIFSLNFNFSLSSNLNQFRADISQSLIQFSFHFRIKLIPSLTTRSLKMSYWLPFVIPILVTIRRRFRGGSVFFRRLLFLQAPTNRYIPK